VVWKLDRLGRSLTQMALILEEMNNHGVALIVTSQGIDTSNTNPAGKLQLNVLMAVAEFERGIIRERGWGAPGRCTKRPGLCLAKEGTAWALEP